MSATPALSELTPRDHALIEEGWLRISGKTCKRPPIGWSCSRGVEHDGPCAARPVEAVHRVGGAE